MIREALNSAQTYIDFEKLAEKISSGEDFTSNEGLSSLINVDKLITDLKAEKVSQSLRDKLYERSIDVQSIEDAKVENERDSSLSKVEKAQIQSLIDHVSEQMEYVSNSRRQSLTFNQFLSNHHFSSPGAYIDFASNLL